MLPEWLHPGFALAEDEELRRLQLRWLRDDLWLRRVSSCAVVASLVGLLLVAVLMPTDALRLAGGGATALSVCAVLLKRLRSGSRR